MKSELAEITQTRQGDWRSWRHNLSAYFITGTDTDVGKTIVTACLAESRKHQGSVLAIKPVGTGITDLGVSPDAEFIAQSAGHEPLIHTALKAPLSPHRAAMMESKVIHPPSLCDWLHTHSADCVLIEGIGGWRVPLHLEEDHCIYASEMAKSVKGRVILVAADRIGVLNHTLLTAEAIQADGLTLHGIVLNQGKWDTSCPSRNTNLLDLTQIFSCPIAVLGAIDIQDPLSRRAAGDRLWNVLHQPVST
jgi:dethiobiotin synthetase